MKIVTSSTSHQSNHSDWIEALFDQMLLAYGKKFTDQWGGTDPDKLYEHWRLQLSGYTPAEITRGVAALESRDWPPTLPEFKKLCRPPVDPIVAYYEAVEGVTARERGENGNWSHPAIFWAAASMAHDLKSMGYSALKAHWEKALTEQMEKGQWAPIPDVMVALPAPGKTKADRQQAEKMLAQYKADAMVQKNDDRAWIGKVLERAKRKDETLPAIAVRFAKEALGVET